MPPHNPVPLSSPAKSLLSVSVSEVSSNFYLVNTNYKNLNLGITAFKRTYFQLKKV
jgi:hypothetical protein